MNLKEKIQTIIIEDSGNLQKICFMEDLADEFAIGFAEWCSTKEFLPNKGWFIGSYELEMGIFKTTKELLEIYKKGKRL
jgi:hypothetical protein